jgi:tetratricopeptide (TPR) repeat protein
MATEAHAVRDYVFLSYSTRNAEVARELGAALRRLGVDAWVDSRDLAGGAELDPEIRRAIEAARHFIVLLSVESIGSSWVQAELQLAQEVRKQRGESYKVIPIVLPPLELGSLRFFFSVEPRALRLESGGIPGLLPELLSALGLQVTDTSPPVPAPQHAAFEELIVELEDPRIDTIDGTQRATATARLRYQPAAGGPEVRSERFRFTAPLGPIEVKELSWYLERYSQWPSDIFQERARRVEQMLPLWGRCLYDAFAPSARQLLSVLKNSTGRLDRRLTVLVDQDLLAHADAEERLVAREAAALLLSLPWELLHDEAGYVFGGAHGVGIRRQLPNRMRKEPLSTPALIRVLLLSPRPEDEQAGYLDHRTSARPLVEALEELSELRLAELKLLTPPTFEALQRELREAEARGQPYHVVHFDGHGVYDAQHGLGALCFEDERDTERIERRGSRLIDAEELGRALLSHRVPLVFLEACQTAAAERDPTASVAGKLLQSGVASVIAMSHAVLVETARRFVEAFYRSLVEGKRIGQATLAGQRTLQENPFRDKVFGKDLSLQDWFVPVLYQQEQDFPIVLQPLSAPVRALVPRSRQLSLGALPVEPGHGFGGRSRELLAVERLLQQKRYAVLRGAGGEGKTTLAAELARWLVMTRRFEQAAFISLERMGEAREVLFLLGEQLVRNFRSQAEQKPELGEGLIQRALDERATVIVIDNVEAVLPPPGERVGGTPLSTEEQAVAQILALLHRLGERGQTRLLFTSREALPEPFHENEIPIGRLRRPEAIELVRRVLGKSNLVPHVGDEGQNEEEIEQLVDSVQCHARSLVLITREVAQAGVRHTTDRLRELMVSLERKHPNDRERSLIASVHLSLLRLPPELRARLNPLAVFHGGGHLLAIAVVLGLNQEKGEHLELAKQLTSVGLAELMPYDYLCLDPALAPALLDNLSPAELKAARYTWAQESISLGTALYYQRAINGHVTATLLPLALPNLLEALEYLRTSASPEVVTEFAITIESHLRMQSRPLLLAKIARIRTEASSRLSGWTNANFSSENAKIDRLLDAYRLGDAVIAARALVRQTEAAGEHAYPEAAYDLAQSHFKLGRLLQDIGHAEEALFEQEQALRGFEQLARNGHALAATMVTACHTERGDCLRDLFRYSEAERAYEESIRQAENRGDPRQIAVAKGQLGTLRMMQGHYDKAIAAQSQAIEVFTLLGEEKLVATAWLQLGNAQVIVGQIDDAEQSFLAALQHSPHPSIQSLALAALGNLYAEAGRLEEAVRMYRRAVNDFGKQGQGLKDIGVRSNIAQALLELRRYDEARRELQVALEKSRSFGVAAEPWDIFGLLFAVEQAAGFPSAAAAARKEALREYLAFRRGGGECLYNPKLFLHIIERQASGTTDDLLAELEEIQQDVNAHPDLRLLSRALVSVLRGNRDSAIAEDPDLHFLAAAELLLLLETLPPLSRD